MRAALKWHSKWHSNWHSRTHLSQSTKQIDSVMLAYHLNKEHWNSNILDGTSSDKDIQMMLGNSYDLTVERVHQGRARFEDTYPVNLLKADRINEYSDEKINYERLSEDQMTGLKYVLNQLKPREKEIVLLRFEVVKTYVGGY